MSDLGDLGIPKELWDKTTVSFWSIDQGRKGTMNKKQALDAIAERLGGDCAEELMYLAGLQDPPGPFEAVANLGPEKGTIRFEIMETLERTEVNGGFGSTRWEFECVRSFE